MTAVRHFQRVNQIINKYGRERAALIPILQAVQAEYRYLPEEILTYIATAMGLPPAAVFGVATFYAQFSLEPKGKYVLRVCDGTACHVRGSQGLLETLREELGLAPGQKTTADLLFTLETVSCLGACGLAPVLMVDEEVHGQMTPEKVHALLTALRRQEEGSVA